MKVSRREFLRGAAGMSAAALAATSKAGLITQSGPRHFTSSLGGGSLEDRPMVTGSNVTYLGAFNVPAGPGFADGGYNFGGNMMTFYLDGSTRSLFMRAFHEGSDSAMLMGQVAIPASFGTNPDRSDWPMATVMQEVTDILHGSNLNAKTLWEGKYYGGMLIEDDRFVFGVSVLYGQLETNDTARMFSAHSLDLSSTDGFISNFLLKDPATNNWDRSVGGPMCWIPEEARSYYGGRRAFSGNGMLSTIGSNSAGACVHAYEPNDIQIGAPPVLLKNCLAYGIAPERTMNWPGDEAPDGEATPMFNLTTRYAGTFWLPGTKSIVFVGGHGAGKYYYGAGRGDGPPVPGETVGYDPFYDDEPPPGGPNPYIYDPAYPTVKGPHAWEFGQTGGYRHQMWVYNAFDTIDVYDGVIGSDIPLPEEIILMPEMDQWETAPNIQGATVEQRSETVFWLYAAAMDNNAPHVHVYEIDIA